MDPESLGGKRLSDFDVIVAREDRHRDYVLSLCPECRDKVVVWNWSIGELQNGLDSENSHSTPNHVN